MVVTSAPANEAELQLYRVMQRASLLAYYDTLLEMGEYIMNTYSYIFGEQKGEKNEPILQF